MKLVSPAFENEGLIPFKYCFEGRNMSPPFKIKKIPKGTKYLNMVCKNNNILHWNILFEPTSKLPSNFERQGRSLIIDILKSYRGPKKEGIYTFNLIALDELKNSLEESTIFTIFQEGGSNG